MVVHDHPALRLSRQYRLLIVGRIMLYYEPKGESAQTLTLMRRIDELFLRHLVYGTRRVAVHLRREGVSIGRRLIADWVRFSNLERPHAALDGRTVAEAFRGDPPLDMMDKPLGVLSTSPQAQQQQEDHLKGIQTA